MTTTSWVWRTSKENSEWGADIDYVATGSRNALKYLSAKPVPKDVLPVYRSQRGLKHFKRFHCPPFGGDPVVDGVWRDIILKFVPADRVQFVPVGLIARGETCDDFMWVVPFDRVECIDPDKSDIRDIMRRDGEPVGYSDIRAYAHFPNCLGELNLARDSIRRVHLVVSDRLRNALAATGEDSMFKLPEDVPTILRPDQ